MSNTNESRFTTTELERLASVLDTIIPPSDDGRLPGAGALGLAPNVDAALDPSPQLRPLLRAGLDTLDAQRGSRFAELALPERERLLREHWEPQGLLGAVLFHTYAAYYQTTRVVEALGLPARAPYPEGYTMEPDDPHVLDAVRERGPLYREA